MFLGHAKNVAVTLPQQFALVVYGANITIHADGLENVSCRRQVQARTVQDVIIRVRTHFPLLNANRERL
jgi:hypothetical protein